VSAAYAQALLIQHLDNFGRQDGLELLDIRKFMSKIMENIPTAALHLNLFALHQSIPFNFLSRSFTSSISCLRVLIACVDFF
jgi:hypothetical protein